jgi:hypothetical protein
MSRSVEDCCGVVEVIYRCRRLSHDMQTTTTTTGKKATVTQYHSKMCACSRKLLIRFNTFYFLFLSLSLSLFLAHVVLFSVILLFFLILLYSGLWVFIHFFKTVCYGCLCLLHNSNFTERIFTIINTSKIDKTTNT